MPVIVHIMANVLAYCLSYTSLAVSGLMSWPACIVFLAVMAVSLLLLHKEKNIL